MKSPLIFVIIVNWNGKQHLADCLPSLAHSRISQRVIVLDNGSNDGSQAWVKTHFPDVQLIELRRNYGFAQANNTGIQAAIQAGAEFVALLNNDTRVEPNWLEALVEVAETDPAVAICQARQYTWDGTAEVHFRFIPEWAEAESELCPIAPPGPPAPTAFASGCAMLVRCTALNQIGLFDERYFMYVEDVDLTLRAWITGYRVMNVPAAIVYHRGIGSNSQLEQRMFWGYRNQLTTILKLYQPETLRRFARPIGQRWFATHNRVALRGTLASLLMLPKTLAHRAHVQRTRQIADNIFLQWCSESS